MATTYVTVTKGQFFSSVGQLNVHPHPHRERTFWQAPNGDVLGITTPGYLGVGERTYSVSAAIAKTMAAALAKAETRE